MAKISFACVALFLSISCVYSQHYHDSRKIQSPLFNKRLQELNRFNSIGVGDASKDDDSSEESKEVMEDQSQNNSSDAVYEFFPVSPTNNISERCIQNSVTPVTCPQDLPDDRLLPHPDDCQLFYYCISSDLPPICRECPAGLHFNPTKKVCDHRETAGCQTLFENASDAIHFEAKTSVDDMVQCDEHNGAYADLKPDPTNCTRYYVCDWGTPLLMHCPANLHFNPHLLVCDNPESAWCQVNATSPIPA